MSKYSLKHRATYVESEFVVCDERHPKLKAVICFRKSGHRGKHRNGKVEW